jgi:uncharacterized protein (TIGR02594 family)
VRKNNGKYTLESGKMKLTCLEKNFQCKLYEIPLFVDNSKVYDNRFRALFMKKEYVLRSAPKAKYNQPYYIDPENGRIVSNETIADRVDLDRVVNYTLKGETDGKLKIKAIVSFIRENVRFTQDETGESELIALLAGNKRKGGSEGFTKLLAEMLNLAGLPSKVIRGELKADGTTNSKNKLNHYWNSIRVGNMDQLFDISLGDRWSNVDPALMIHSHFPEDTAQQFLEVALSKLEFERLVYSAPTRENAEYAHILPQKGMVHIKDHMELLFTSEISIVHAEVQSMDSDNATVYAVRPTSTMTSGKTRVVIPIKEKNALLKVRTSSGMELTYRIQNDGIQDDEIAAYYQEMRSIAATNSRMRARQNATSSASQRSANSNAAVFIENARFRSDVLTHLITDFKGFDHPMIRTAVALYGTSEIPGAENNPKIVEFFHATGHRNIHDDETHWCSAFIMYCAKMNGFDYPKNALARSWMKVGEKVEKPEVGDLVVFGWGQTYTGHVAIYLGESNGWVVCLGGNQGNEVNVMPFSKESILGYRRLKE